MCFFDEITSIFNKYGYQLSSQQAEMFEKYYNMLIEANNKINLTSITEQRDVIVKHFLDSVIASNFIPKGVRVIDIGCGAGFPSIPIKIMREDLDFLLVDSVNKKVNFVNEAITNLEMQNISALHSRIEDLAHKTEYCEKFDIVVSRAVAKLNTLCEYAIPFLSVGGIFVAYKSDSIEEELEEAKKAISLLGGQIDKIFNCEIEDNKRSLIIIKKVKQTPEKYPRDKNKPRLDPL